MKDRLELLPERHTDFVLAVDVGWLDVALLSLAVVVAGLGLWWLAARRRRR